MLVITGPAAGAWHLARYFGIEWLLWRLGYELCRKTGWLKRRTPVSTWRQNPLEDCLQRDALARPEVLLAYRRQEAPTFLFDPSQRHVFAGHFPRWDSADVSPLVAAAALERGELTYFSHAVGQVGLPPRWHQNPFTGSEAPAIGHWSEIDDFRHGDIRVIWEPSRFGFVYALVRAYWRNGDERYPDLFWRLLEDWRAHNPPNQGPNWKCGQEISLRVMAWSFGLYGFLFSSATTAPRVAGLLQMMALSGKRVQANLSYALHQRNNHGISEGMGLWTIGTLFPELKPAASWALLGRRVLEDLGRQLISDDGSFSQHSVNYHRLTIHVYLWCLQLARLNGRPFSALLEQRVPQLGDWLYQLQAGRSGEVPRYGQNDGALALPLNNCEFEDYRPAIQVAHFFGTARRDYEDGPWDEDLLWLFGPDSVHAPARQPTRGDWQAPDGGYYALRSPESMVFVRCGALKFRPSQADMLHVDLWWQGRNVAIDPGTYSYNAPAPWDNPLSATRYHNTVTVDGVEQMERIGRFLWLPWVRGRLEVFRRSERGHLAYWQGRHDGYGRLPRPVAYRRGVLQVGPDTWFVLDDLWSPAAHDYRLHWLIADVPFDWDQDRGALSLNTASGPYYLQLGSSDGGSCHSLIRGDKDSPRGWYSPYYMARQPALSVITSVRVASTRLWTLLGPGAGEVDWRPERVRIASRDWQVQIDLTRQTHGSLVALVALSGTWSDTLEVGS